MAIDLNTINKSQFTNDPYIRRVEKPWGYELHWTPDACPYMGKILHINVGKRLSLQIHDEKSESWFIMSGQAKVVWETKEGEMIETVLEPGFGYTTHVGQKHRLVGVTDCDVIEVSTPELGTTLRVEDDYHRPDEDEKLRSEPNRGWNG